MDLKVFCFCFYSYKLTFSEVIWNWSAGFLTIVYGDQTKKNINSIILKSSTASSGNAPRNYFSFQLNVWVFIRNHTVIWLSWKQLLLQDQAIIADQGCHR